MPLLQVASLLPIGACYPIACCMSTSCSASERPCAVSVACSAAISWGPLQPPPRTAVRGTCGRQVGFDDSAKGAMFVFETFMDLIFLIDLVINFRTGGHAAAAVSVCSCAVLSRRACAGAPFSHAHMRTRPRANVRRVCGDERGRRRGAVIWAPEFGHRIACRPWK